MERNRISAGVGRIIALALFGSLVACDFEPDVPNIPWPTPPERPFGGFSSRPENPDEASEADVDRLINELFDPYNLPGDRPYRGSVYERMDMILMGAYTYYGYDLAKLAISRQDNPLSEGMFLDYLLAQGGTVVNDPATGTEYDIFQWFLSGTVGGGEGIYPRVLHEIGEIDTTFRLNYERNYLAALLYHHPGAELFARRNLRNDLSLYFGEDSAATYEYLNNLDLFGVE